MQVYAVAAYDDYYPNPDNVKKVFLSYESAQLFAESLKNEENYAYDYIEIFTYNVEE